MRTSPRPQPWATPSPCPVDWRGHVRARTGPTIQARTEAWELLGDRLLFVRRRTLCSTHKGKWGEIHRQLLSGHREMAERPRQAAPRPAEGLLLVPQPLSLPSSLRCNCSGGCSAVGSSWAGALLKRSQAKLSKPRSQNVYRIILGRAFAHIALFTSTSTHPMSIVRMSVKSNSRSVLCRRTAFPTLKKSKRWALLVVSCQGVEAPTGSANLCGPPIWRTTIKAQPAPSRQREPPMPPGNRGFWFP